MKRINFITIAFLSFLFFGTAAKAQLLPCSSITIEAFPLNPQSGPHNYFGVRVTLDRVYDQNITVHGYIFDLGGGANTNNPFTLTVTAGNLTEETSATFYETDATAEADFNTTSISPANVTSSSTTYNTQCSVASISIVFTAINDTSKTNLMIRAFDSLQVNLTDLSTELGLSSTLSASDIDFVNLYSSYNSGDTGSALTASFKANSSSNSVNFGFTLFKNGAYYTTPTIVRTNTGVDLKLFDLTSDSVTVISDYNTGSYSSSTTAGNYTTQRTGCSHAVNDCILDAYSNHGWASVWAFIQSAFLPVTTVAIATACILKNCR